VSRIGKLPIEIPKGVEVKIENGVVTVKGPKGQLEQKVNPGIVLEMDSGIINVKRPSDERNWRSLHGLTRTLVNNMVVGVTQGFTKHLQIEGVGYRAEKKGKGVQLALGFSHPIYFIPPKNVDINVPAPNRIEVSGIDKVLVGQIAAKVRSFRPPEPYKGKGVRYENEYVRRKAGKTAK
jgi:large subunit ribosomal protein L6